MTMVPSTLSEALADRYKVLEEIGRGGMATVYRAHDVKHDRAVALKVLHDDLAANLGPERFKREILIAARLQHPHILSVFDSGETAGRLWFTMPFVNGETLRDRLRREGALPLDAALLIAREAAQALAYAHKQGVIHRDIKPENILLTEDGSTLVADFGIARAVGDRSFERGLTQTGTSIGTPTYMAPEQATGETVLDERVDQYALAAVLYEMLTGAPPFTAANAAALIAVRFTSAVTPVRAQRPEIPADVDAAVLRALSLKPFDRFPTITDFARAVAPAVATPQQFDTLPRPALRAPRRRRWLAGAGLLALVTVAAAALWQRGAGAAAPDDPVRIAVLPLQNLGDSADAYFADGMSDELRGKLVGVPGLEVIARASSVRYAGSTSTPREIAEELGVRYLLTGTLRYEHRADGSSTVQIRPELVEVSGAGAATTRWQGAYDEPLTNAATLQARIAERVATELRITLAPPTRTRLARALTSSPVAYEAYLRALARVADNSITGLRERAADLERAVELDPTFGMAWADLARVRAVQWDRASDTGLAAKVREAAERARAAAPGEVADHLAWYWYHSIVTGEQDAAERAIRAALALEPDNPAFISRLATQLFTKGQIAEARPLFARAVELDPKSAVATGNLGTALLADRRYAEAIGPLQKVAEMRPNTPTSIHALVMLYAGMGDLERARAVIRDGYRRIAPEELDVYLAYFQDYGWLLEDEAQRRVLAAPIAAFDSSPGAQAIVRAHIHHARGEFDRSRAAARQAVVGLADQARKSPDDPQWVLIGGFAAALAGQPAEANRLIEAAREVERRRKPTSMEAGYYHELRARVHTLNGEPDKALDEIEQALAMPGYLGRGQLALDPMWAPLRSHPRYQRIMTTASAQELR